MERDENEDGYNKKMCHPLTLNFFTMYSNKQNVNILTSLLIAKGITKAVLCPGSRNIPIVANLLEAEEFECFPVTDERSAAFYALGISLATRSPAVVCVTSGSAFLNALPAMAEAFYRKAPVILVSADRPKEWIDRLDGQTMMQHGHYGNVFKNEVDIDDFDSDDKNAADYSTLLINMSLNAVSAGGMGPVHINIHLDEPLFVFERPQLPSVRNVIPMDSECVIGSGADCVIEDFLAAESKIIAIGQLSFSDPVMDNVIRQLSKRYVVVAENLSTASCTPFDRAMKGFSHQTSDIPVGYLLSLGGTFVSKGLKRFLRGHDVWRHCEINEDGVIHDTFSCQTSVLKCNTKAFLERLLRATEKLGGMGSRNPDALKVAWDTAVRYVADCIDSYMPRFSQLSVIRDFELSLEDMYYDYEVHYANSMEIRVGCLYSSGFIWCNRGVNGIEGCLSTAAGFSLATRSMVFCVIGDLSFFYDQNALWNNSLKGNFRVLLLNNSCGGIFSQLSGLNVSDRTKAVIEGRHKANARGICEQNDIGYISARDSDELRAGMVHFLTEETTRPMVLEVFTSADDDRDAFIELNSLINNK